MAVYENRFWRTVGRNYDSMEKHAPEGYTARVEVHLHGAIAPLHAVLVESREDDPWLLFHVYGSLSEEAHPEDRLVFAHDTTVARVDVAYVRKPDGKSIGFRVTEPTD